MTQVQMPENLSDKDIDSIVYVFGHMAILTKQEFLASLMMKHPEHYIKITNAIGKAHNNFIAMA
jgi:hypothetical protein